MKIRVGDTVVVIAGKDKGKTGEVLQVLAKEERVIVEGVNIVTKHVKPSQLILKVESLTKKLQFMFLMLHSMIQNQNLQLKLGL